MSYGDNCLSSDYNPNAQAYMALLPAAEPHQVPSQYPSIWKKHCSIDSDEVSV